jgi:hypothetical protein
MKYSVVLIAILLSCCLLSNFVVYCDLVDAAEHMDIDNAVGAVVDRKDVHVSMSENSKDDCKGEVDKNQGPSCELEKDAVKDGVRVDIPNVDDQDESNHVSALDIPSGGFDDGSRVDIMSSGDSTTDNSDSEYNDAGAYNPDKVEKNDDFSCDLEENAMKDGVRVDIPDADDQDENDHVSALDIPSGGFDGGSRVDIMSSGGSTTGNSDSEYDDAGAYNADDAEKEAEILEKLLQQSTICAKKQASDVDRSICYEKLLEQIITHVVIHRAQIPKEVTVPGELLEKLIVLISEEALNDMLQANITMRSMGLEKLTIESVLTYCAVAVENHDKNLVKNLKIIRPQLLQLSKQVVGYDDHSRGDNSHDDDGEDGGDYRQRLRSEQNAIFGYIISFIDKAVESRIYKTQQDLDDNLDREKAFRVQLEKRFVELRYFPTRYNLSKIVNNFRLSLEALGKCWHPDKYARTEEAGIVSYNRCKLYCSQFFAALQIYNEHYGEIEAHYERQQDSRMLESLEEEAKPLCKAVNVFAEALRHKDAAKALIDRVKKREKRVPQ